MNLTTDIFKVMPTLTPNQLASKPAGEIAGQLVFPLGKILLEQITDAILDQLKGKELGAITFNPVSHQILWTD